MAMKEGVRAVSKGEGERGALDLDTRCRASQRRERRRTNQTASY